MNISIILVHFHTEGLLKSCLQHCLASLAAGAITGEILVVDNGSNTQAMTALHKEFPGIHWMRNADNLGFAKACNQALALATGKYMLFLNPDAIPSPTSIGQLIRRMEEDPRIGIASGRHQYPDGRLQPSCRRFPTLWNTFTNQLGLDKIFPHSRWLNRYKMGDFRHDKTQEVDQVMGACMIVRKNLLDQIGNFDERFFLYFEEVDLCWRAKKAGWKILFFADPPIAITHVGGASSSEQIPLRIYHRYRSLCLWLHKVYPFFAVAIFKMVLLIGIVLRLCASGIRGSKDKCQAYCHTLCDWPHW